MNEPKEEDKEKKCPHCNNSGRVKLYQCSAIARDHWCECVKEVTYP